LKGGGGRRKGPPKYATDAEESSVNEGNFRELLKFRVNAGDSALKDHLMNASARATYISKTVQNELIECCGNVILSNICQCITNSGYYSILFDETTDLSHTIISVKPDCSLR